MTYLYWKTRLFVFSAVVSLICCFSNNASGLDIHWTGGGGDAYWDNPANWDAGVVPGAEDHAIVDLPGDYPVFVIGAVTVGELTVGAESGTQIIEVGTGSELNGNIHLSANGYLYQLGGLVQGSVSITGQYEWQTGEIAASVYVDQDGILQIPDGGPHFLSGTITNAGTIDCSAVNITEGTIHDNGTFVLRADCSFDNVEFVGGTFHCPVESGTVKLTLNGIKPFSMGNCCVPESAATLWIDCQISDANGLAVAYGGGNYSGLGITRLSGQWYSFESGYLEAGSRVELDGFQSTEFMYWNSEPDATLSFKNVVFRGVTELSWGVNSVLLEGCTMDMATFANYGTMTCRAPFSEASQGHFENTEGLLILEGDFGFGGDTLVWNEYGTIRVPANMGEVVLGAWGTRFELSGTLEVGNNSVLRLGADSEFYLSDSWELAITGPGTTVFDDLATWDCNNNPIITVSPESTVQLRAPLYATFSGGGSLNLDGNIGGGSITAAADMRVNLFEGCDYQGTFYNYGTATCSGGFVTLNDTWENYGRLVLENNATISGWGTIQNMASGVIESRLPGWEVETNVVQCILQNEGTLELQPGTLRLEGPYTPSMSAEHHFLATGTNGFGYAILECMQPLAAAGAVFVELAYDFAPMDVGIPLIQYPEISGEFSPVTLSPLSGGYEWVYETGPNAFVFSVTGDPPPPTPPSIVAQPQSVSAEVGGTAVFSVGAIGTNLVYGWKKDGTKLNNSARIIGANSANLTLTQIMQSDAGAYSVTITNSGGTVTSLDATLTVAQRAPSDIYWTGAAGDGAWANAGNWSPAVLPGAHDRVIVDLPGSYTITVDVPVCVSNLVIGATSGKQTLALSEGSLLNAATLVSSNGIISQAGGRVEGIVNVGGRYVWQKGEIAATVQIPTNGIMDISGTNSHPISGAITNLGTIYCKAVSISGGGTVEEYGNFVLQTNCVLDNVQFEMAGNLRQGTLVCPAGSGPKKLTVTGTNWFYLGDCSVGTNASLWIDSLASLVEGEYRAWAGGKFAGPGVTKLSGNWGAFDYCYPASGSRVEVDGAQIAGILDWAGEQGGVATFRNVVFPAQGQFDYDAEVILLEGCSMAGGEIENNGTIICRASLVEGSYGMLWNREGVLSLETNVHFASVDIMNVWGAILVPPDLGEVRLEGNYVYLDGGIIRVETNSVLGFGNGGLLTVEFMSDLAFAGQGKIVFDEKGGASFRGGATSIDINSEHTVQVETGLPNLVFAGSGVLNLTGTLRSVITANAGIQVNLLEGLRMEGSLVNYGTATCKASSLALNGSFENFGRLTLQNGCNVLGTGKITNAPSGVIEVINISGPSGFGTTRVECSMQNDGTLKLNPGTLRVEGVYKPTASARHQFLSTRTNGYYYATLQCVQPLAAAGSVSVELAQNFVSSGTNYLVRYPSCSGRFSPVNLPPSLPDGQVWQTQYGPNSFYLFAGIIKPTGKAPVVSILSPVNGARTQSVVLSGTATEDQNIAALWYWFTNVNQGVTTVTASNNLVGAQGASLGRSGTAWTWSVPVTPLPGSNSVVVVAVNQRGQSSVPVFRKFFYKVGHQVPLSITGDLTAAGSNLVKLTSIIAGDLTAYVGATNPFPSTTVTLWEGQTYTMRITADKGTWYTNTVITAGSYNYDTTSKTFSFQARSNMTITVDLRTNRFTAGLSGLWNGLFQVGSDPGQVTMTNAGALTAFKIDKLKGTYSGKIMLKGKSWPVKGGFSTSGQTTNRIIYINTTTGQSNYIADLEMTLPFETPNTNAITGLITHATENWSANLKLVRQDTNNFSGTNMTLVIPGATDPAQGPGGYGYAKLAFGPVGSVGFAGLLGDGSKIAFKASLSTGRQIPVFSAMLPNAQNVCRAMLFGWMDLAENSATLTWIKNAGTWTNYAAGFIAAPTATYGAYVAPAPGRSPFAIAPSLMEVEASVSSPDLIYNVALTNANTRLTKLPGSPTNWLSGNIVPLSGTVIGDFGNGWGKTKLKYSLGILQGQNAAYGFYAGTNRMTAPVILH